MNAAKRNQKPPPASDEAAGGPLSAGGSLTADGSLRRWAVGAIVVAGLIAAAYWGWGRWGPRIAASGDYVLQAENVQITPPPPWIRADVRAEVVRNGGLAGLSLLDQHLTVKVYQAFALHSWVENVNRVSKTSRQQPARVTVELAYRKPVAMVEVVINDRRGLLPVDAAAVLLPPHDFTAEQTRDYLRISVPYATATNPVGMPWGQPEIHEAARIAAVLEDHWQQCGLYRIQLVPSGSEDSTQIQPAFELQSRSGAAILWGRAPDRGEMEAAAAIAKLARILQYVQSHGSLESASPGLKLDLRQPVPAARTARRPAFP